VFHQDLLMQGGVFEKLIAMTVISEIFVPDIHVLL